MHQTFVGKKEHSTNTKEEISYKALNIQCQQTNQSLLSKTLERIALICFSSVAIGNMIG